MPASHSTERGLRDEPAVPGTPRGVRLAVAYLWLQGAGVPLFWAVLLLWPSARSHFAIAGWPDATLLVFWLPDLLVVTAGSLATAVALPRRPAVGRAALWFTAGGLFYATLWCLTVSATTGSGLLGSGLMLLATVGTGAVLLQTSGPP